MSPLRVVVLVLACAAVANAIRPTSSANLRFRRRAPFDPNECKQADFEKVAGTKADWDSAADSPAVPSDLQDSNGHISVVGATENTLKWDKTKKIWRYGAGNVDSATGVSIAGKKMNLDDGQPFTDLCKIYPAWCPAFCTGDNKAAFCCPAKTDVKAACPASVTGVPRKYMPQLIKPFATPGTEADVASGGAWAAKIPEKYTPTGASSEIENPFIKWVKTTHSDFSCDLADVKISDLKPTQDEISGFKSVKMYCEQIKIKPNWGAKIAPRPVVCKDNRIFDGHHRWSAFKFAAENGLKDAAGTVIGADYTIKVYKCNQNCDALMKLIKTLYGSPHGVKKVEDKGVEFAFAELEALFGRSAHSTMEQAQAAYVDQTRARMAQFGLEMKGGDVALSEMFHAVAGHLWN